MIGAVWVGTPATDVELRNVFDGDGAAPLEPDESMFSGTEFTRTAAAGALPHAPLLCSDIDRVLLINSCSEEFFSPLYERWFVPLRGSPFG